MNVADSQRVGSSLEHLGYTFTDKAEEADVIVLNTCVVRQSAEDKALGRLGSQPICHIDGLEPDGRGGYTVTDWLTGDVLAVSAEGTATPIMKLVQGSADHTYLESKQLLIIPLMNNNVLRAYRWAPLAAAK